MSCCTWLTVVRRTDRCPTGEHTTYSLRFTIYEFSVRVYRTYHRRSILSFRAQSPCLRSRPLITTEIFKQHGPASATVQPFQPHFAHRFTFHDDYTLLKYKIFLFFSVLTFLVRTVDRANRLIAPIAKKDVFEENKLKFRSNQSPVSLSFF